MTARMTKPKKRVQGELMWEDGNDTGGVGIRDAERI